MISSFETIARHFAGKLKVKLHFKDKICPQTDGESRIILPTDMGDLTLPTLGALIHESYHIRNTGKLENCYQKFYDLNKKWFNGNSWHMKKHYSFLTNLLEDIRIDTMVLKKYDNAKYIYSTLIEFGCDMHAKSAAKKAKSKEPVKVKDVMGTTFVELTQQIYIYALDFDEKYYFNPTLIKSFISKYKKQLDEILDNVKVRAQVVDLHQDVDKLWTIIKEFLKIKEQEKVAEEPTKGGQQGKSEGKIKKQIKKEYKKIKQEKIKDTKGEIEDIDSEIKELEDEIKELEDEEENEDFDSSSNKKETKKINDKINKKNNEIKELKDEIKQDEKAIDKIEKTDGDLDEVIDDILEEEFGNDVLENLMNGFKCIKKISEDLKSNPVDLHDFEGSLKEIFKRTEKKKTYTTHATPHINIKNLHKIYKHEGELDDLFSETKKVETFNNKLIFLIDSSSSMGACFKKYANDGKEDYKLSKKNTLVFDCLENIRKVVEENKETYNIDYAIITFASSNQFGIVKGFEDNFKDTDHFMKRYVEKYYNGSTDVIPALEKCYDLFDKHCEPNDKRFIICLTDGQFTSGDTETILHEYNARAEKVVFIGINNKEVLENRGSTVREFLEKILMGRVVNTVKEMELTLIESLDRIL